MLPSDEQVRTELGTPRKRTLPEMMLTVLNAANRDADQVEATGARSARQQLHDVAGGYTVYDSLRNLLEQFPAIATRGLDREWQTPEPDPAAHAWPCPFCHRQCSTQTDLMDHDCSAGAQAEADQ